MATSTNLLQHPLHDQHPLEPRDFRKDSIKPACLLCYWMIPADGYACEECGFYAHGACAEAPPRIDPHPLHTDHPLTLVHSPLLPFRCDPCGEDEIFDVSSFRCDECDFNLDIRCALATLSDRGGTRGKTPEQIKLPFHRHPLTSFYTRHDFIGDGNCVICKASVEGDGYACLNRRCEFLIHKKCIQDLYYTDGTRAPRIYHGHPLKTFLGEEMGSTRCANCRSKESREFVGCGECQVFYCRDCVQVPESIQYPHHRNLTLVLLISSLDIDKVRCDCCTYNLKGKLCYGCPSFEFFVDLRCALQVLAYCEKGMTAEIEMSWHEHQLYLCHRTKDDSDYCSYCEEKSAGPMYACKEKGCKILVHKRCIEIEVPAILQYSHHPDHPLTLCRGDDFRLCKACCDGILHLSFSCELCAFYLHPKCTARFPTRKHPLHEHELLHLDKPLSRGCNRCGTRIDSPFFRCVSCNFDLHEKCMELPQVVKSEIHWHELTLHETYVEDDSGEYYCDKCEKRRDERMGAYVCLQCRQRWAYHIECVFPELRNVFVKQQNAVEIERLADDIARREEEVRKVETKLEEMKRELDEQRKKHAALTFG